jgi:hypothetical protein
MYSPNRAAAVELVETIFYRHLDVEGDWRFDFDTATRDASRALEQAEQRGFDQAQAEQRKRRQEAKPPAKKPKPKAKKAKPKKLLVRARRRYRPPAPKRIRLNPTPLQMFDLAQALGTQPHRQNCLAQSWVGKLIAPVLDLDPIKDRSAISEFITHSRHFQLCEIREDGDWRPAVKFLPAVWLL